jgi:hypothetical protein
VVDVNYESLQDAEMRALARELGAEAAAGLNLEGTAQAVVRRLRDEHHPARATSWQPQWMAAAAMIVLLLGGGMVWREMRLRQVTPVVALAPADLDLNNLSAEQLQELLNAVDQPLDFEATSSADTELDDLTPRELRTLLRALEG